MRRELLNAYSFTSLQEIRTMAEEWRMDYNLERPHKALGYLSPVNYLKQWEDSNSESSSKAGLSTPASENNLSFEAQRVVDNPCAVNNLNPLLLN